jgi:hypothetical protein
MKLPEPLVRIGDYSVAAIAASLPAAADPLWEAERFRQTSYAVHRLTRSILFDWLDNDWRLGSPMKVQRYDYAPAALRAAVDDCVVQVLGFYPGARLARATLAELGAGAAIAPHRDNGIGITAVHRIHVPVLTNPQVHFFIDRVPHYLQADTIYEFDNTRLHAVENRSSERRVHLMLDFMPAALVVA